MADPITAVTGSFNKLTDLVSEFIVDKDKQIEFQFKLKELELETKRLLIGTSTIPWVDALVKLTYALTPFFRPCGSALMTAFGAYCHWKGIDLGDAVYLFDGAFPAWGTSRHFNRTREIVETGKTKRLEAVEKGRGGVNSPPVDDPLDPYYP